MKGPRVLFDVSEKVRKILELHFHLETPLYFSYTHLVCRSAIDGVFVALSTKLHVTLAPQWAV